MIKVLVVSTIGLGLYGITNSIMNYYRFMDKSDIQMDFATPNKVADRLKIEIQSNGGRIYDNLKRNTNPFKYMYQLCSIIKQGKYDIIHAHGNSNTLAIEMKVAKMCRVKVRIAHCHSSTCDHKLLHNLLKHLFNRSYTHGFACSQLAGKWLYGDKPFTVINNGIDVMKFQYNEEDRNEYRQKLGYEKNKVIGHIGHFSYQKNHEYLIRIFHEIYKKDPSYRLLLIGDGDLIGRIKKQVSDLGLTEVVNFYGETLDVTKLLLAMDIFVFPSEVEGLGIVVIEAQAAGLPCIVSNAIPIEARYTQVLDYASLEEPLDSWVNKIMAWSEYDRETGSQDINNLVYDSNYNIENEVIKLKNLYFDYISSS